MNIQREVFYKEIRLENKHNTLLRQQRNKKLILIVELRAMANPKFLEKTNTDNFRANLGDLDILNTLYLRKL